VLAQHSVVQPWTRLVQIEVQGKVRVVVEVGPVLMIQSMKPASTSGTRHEMARPAGVRAPLRDRPTVPVSASIRSAYSWQASRSRPALYDRENVVDQPAATASGR